MWRAFVLIDQFLQKMTMIYVHEKQLPTVFVVSRIVYENEKNTQSVSIQILHID